MKSRFHHSLDEIRGGRLIEMASIKPEFKPASAMLSEEGPKRFHPNQLSLIDKATSLRKAAIDLRHQVSEGSYDDPELRRFYALIETAPFVLYVSNPELAERAGLGDKFFSTVSRDGRRPKLENFLRALTAIIEIANERLHEIDRNDNSNVLAGTAKIQTRIRQDHAELKGLSASLGRLARQELEDLDAHLPNDPDSLVQYERQRELLLIFAEGFERMAKALMAFGASPHEPILLGKAAGIVSGVAKELSAWWLQNGAEAVDWAIRIPVFVGGVGALGWAGADMTVATTAMAAMVGGEKVMKVIKKVKKSK